jgi:hypothetical protein
MERSFKQYLAESERSLSGPVTEDLFDLQINETFCIESEVLEHDDVSVTILVDDEAMNILDSLGMLEEEPAKLTNLNKADIAYDLGDGYYVASFDVGDNERAAVQREVYKLENPAAMDNPQLAGWRFIDYISLPARTTKDAVIAAGEKMKQDDMQKNQDVSPMAEDDVEETVKPGTKVKIHAPGKSYHDQVGHVGEIRHGKYQGAPKTYTVDYGDRKSVQLDKKNIKVHKEVDDELPGKKSVASMAKNDLFAARRAAKKEVDEAEYQGRQVKLGKPMAGDVKKYKVYVRNPKTGKIKKVNFGDKGMEIKRDNPARRKNFRARHNCSQKKDRTKAGYWSCRMWSRKPVSKIVRGK